MPWQAVVLIVLFGLCIEGLVITWRLTDPVLDEQVHRAITAEERSDWQAAEIERLARDRRLLRWQVLSAGLTPVVDLQPGADVPASDVVPVKSPEASE